MASHLPLLKGKFEPLLYLGLGGIIGTAPLSDVYITYVFSSNPNAFKRSSNNPTPLSKSSVIAAKPACL